MQDIQGASQRGGLDGRGHLAVFNLDRASHSMAHEKKVSLTNLFEFSEYISELGDNGSVMGNLSAFQGGI